MTPQTMSRGNDWSSRDLAETIKFFGWIDALNRESERQGRGQAWPGRADPSAALDDWLSYFDLGLTPSETLTTRSLPIEASLFARTATA